MIQQEDILYGKISVAGMPVIVGTEIYQGSYEITPKVSAQTMATAFKTMVDNVNIKAISTYKVSNPSGITFIIGDV